MNLISKTVAVNFDKFGPFEPQLLGTSKVCAILFYYCPKSVPVLYRVVVYAVPYVPVVHSTRTCTYSI